MAGRFEGFDALLEQSTAETLRFVMSVNDQDFHKVGER